MRTMIKRLLLTILLLMPFAAAYGVASSYERSLANVLVSEGYTYTNVPGDPGGPTNYGVTIYDVRKYLLPNATAQDVRALTLAQAKAIYHAHYWVAINGDALPAGLDYTVFDYGVNAGPSRALYDLRACHGIAADENDGTDAATPQELIKCVNNRRMRFQMALPSRLDKFKRGWRNRIKSVTNISLSMAGGKPLTATLGMDLYSVPRVGIGKAYDETTEEIR